MRLVTRRSSIVDVDRSASHIRLGRSADATVLWWEAAASRAFEGGCEGILRYYSPFLLPSEESLKFHCGELSLYLSLLILVHQSLYVFFTYGICVSVLGDGG